MIDCGTHFHCILNLGHSADCLNAASDHFVFLNNWPALKLTAKTFFRILLGVIFLFKKL